MGGEPASCRCEEPHRARRRAFTLIELLVVVAIIALLMAILMPALQRIKEQAKAVACQANLRQWALYFSMYTQDNNGYFHRGWNIGSETHTSWMTALRPYYVDHREICCCPTATTPYGQAGRPAFSAWENFYNEYGSYGINIWVTNPEPGKEGGKPADNYWRHPDATGVAGVPLFLDDLWWDTRPHHTDEPPQHEGQVDDWTTNAMKMFCIQRHNGFVSGAFVDFSTRKVGLKELWALKWHRAFNSKGPWTKAGAVQPGDWPEWMRHFKDY